MREVWLFQHRVRLHLSGTPPPPRRAGRVRVAPRVSHSRPLLEDSSSCAPASLSGPRNRQSPSGPCRSALCSVRSTHKRLITGEVR